MDGKALAPCLGCTGPLSAVFSVMALAHKDQGALVGYAMAEEEQEDIWGGDFVLK